MLPTAEIFPINVNSARLSLSDYSREKGQPIYKNSDGRLFFGIFSKPDIPSTSGDTFHTVVQGEELRLDVLAYKYYRTPELWWVIALANNLVSVFDDVKPGDVLLIPDSAAVLGNL